MPHPPDSPGRATMHFSISCVHRQSPASPALGTRVALATNWISTVQSLLSLSITLSPQAGLERQVPDCLIKETGEERLGSKLRATSLIRTARVQPGTNYTLVSPARVPGGLNGQQLVHRQQQSPTPYSLSYKSSHSSEGSPQTANAPHSVRRRKGSVPLPS